jgi:hypothetical protein
MQEVRSSNLLSSTQARIIIRNPEPTFRGSVQQRNTATQRHYVPPVRRDLAPLPDGKLLAWPLEAGAEMGLERPDQEECSVPLTALHLPLCQRAAPLAGDSCRLRNSSRQLPPTCRCGRSARPQAGWTGGAALRAGFAPGAIGSVFRRECLRRGAIRHNSRRADAAPSAGQAHDGAPDWPGNTPANRLAGAASRPLGYRTARSV